MKPDQHFYGGIAGKSAYMYTGIDLLNELFRMKANICEQ